MRAHKYPCGQADCPQSFCHAGLKTSYPDAKDAEIAALKAKLDPQAKVLDPNENFASELMLENTALKAKLAEVEADHGCEFCAEGAECCKPFDNSYGGNGSPSIEVCTTCWNRAQARIEILQSLIQAAPCECSSAAAVECVSCQTRKGAGI